jgi:hypothetical protein
VQPHVAHESSAGWGRTITSHSRARWERVDGWRMPTRGEAGNAASFTVIGGDVGAEKRNPHHDPSSAHLEHGASKAHARRHDPSTRSTRELSPSSSGPGTVARAIRRAAQMLPRH